MGLWQHRVDRAEDRGLVIGYSRPAPHEYAGALDALGRFLRRLG
jgi:hypothetical protein